MPKSMQRTSKKFIPWKPDPISTDQKDERESQQDVGFPSTSSSNPRLRQQSLPWAPDPIQTKQLSRLIKEETDENKQLGILPGMIATPQKLTSLASSSLPGSSELPVPHQLAAKKSAKQRQMNKLQNMFLGKNDSPAAAKAGQTKKKEKMPCWHRVCCPSMSKTVNRE